MPVSAGGDVAETSLDNFTEPNTAYVVFVTTATFDGVSKHDVFSFMGNPANDSVWWPGFITNVTQTNGNGPGAGAQYAEEVLYGAWTNLLTLDAHHSNKFTIQVTEGGNGVASWSIVDFDNVQGDGRWTSYSVIEQSPLLPIEQLEGLLATFYGVAANAMGANSVSVGFTNYGVYTTDSNGEFANMPFNVGDYD